VRKGHKITTVLTPCPTAYTNVVIQQWRYFGWKNYLTKRNLW